MSPVTISDPGCKFIQWIPISIKHYHVMYEVDVSAWSNFLDFLIGSIMAFCEILHDATPEKQWTKAFGRLTLITPTGVGDSH